MKRYGKIVIDSKENRCFFHVLGDVIEYHDVTSLERAHPELRDEIEEKRVELECELLRQRELLSVEVFK